MGLLVTCLIMTALFIVFPKGFAYTVGACVGAAGGILVWSAVTIAAFLALGDVTWEGMGWSLLIFIVIGIAGGIVAAVRL